MTDEFDEVATLVKQGRKPEARQKAIAAAGRHLTDAHVVLHAAGEVEAATALRWLGKALARGSGASVHHE